MNKILAALLIASALSSSAALAEDRFRVSLEDGKQRVDFTLDGTNLCVMLDDKIVCKPIPKEQVRVASSDSN